MSSKDNKDNPKTRLMDELKSIKGVLDEDDDNVPLLLGDEDDVPVLAADDDIPVLTSPETDAEAKNQASLQDALRQLESLELSPKSSRNRTEAPPAAGPPASLEEKIRANAAPPIIKTTMESGRENPFLTRKPKEQLEESRKQAEKALSSVIGHARGAGKITTPPKKEPVKGSVLTIKDDPSATPVEFNLKPKPKEATATSTPTKPGKPEPEDASNEILKLMGESRELELDLDEDLDEKFSALQDIDLDNLGEMDPDEEDPPAKTASAKSAATKSSSVSEKDLDKVIDEIVEEYLVILEAALKKKLKEKFPDLLKK